ncbi:hypothetical protein AG4045_023684 [Apium graveolens]|uniref:Uncharacterized protein n=2 Tax=Apium graveolens TaxID=4045 RepID=A0A6L5BBW0_APIGR|nr:hypothetical protein AG4045_023684 [Apium graveolens]
MAGKENAAPAKMNGKALETKTRHSGEKDERNVFTEDAIDREVMNMMRRDYHPRGRTTGRHKPPIHNHNHKH